MTPDTNRFLRSLPDGTRVGYCRMAIEDTIACDLVHDPRVQVQQSILKLAGIAADRIDRDMMIPEELVVLEGKTGNRFIIVTRIEEHEDGERCLDCDTRPGM